jgi:hypothetical protein
MNLCSSSNNTKPSLSLPSGTINSIYDEQEIEANQSKSICDTPSSDPTTSIMTCMNKHSKTEFFTNRKVIADPFQTASTNSSPHHDCHHSEFECVSTPTQDSLPSDVLDDCQT